LFKEMKKSTSEASASSSSYPPPSILSEEEETIIESDHEIIKFSEAIKMSEIEKCKNKKNGYISVSLSSPLMSPLCS
jgi:hypothetical protein